MNRHLSVILKFMLLSISVTPCACALEIQSVTARQRYPWNGLVDITCNVSGINGTTNGLKFAASAVDVDTGDTYEISNFWTVRSGTNSTDRTVTTNGNYRLVWDARTDLGQMIYSNMVVRVTTCDAHNKVQLWDGGPYWADTNIGATEPWEYGYYFWWGDTVGCVCENGAWVASDGSSSYSVNVPNIYARYLRQYGWTTADDVLVPEHDAAHVQWGGGWRMPTRLDLQNLNNKCDWTWTTTNGINGYVVRGRGTYASASIFLPAAGYRDNYIGSLGCYWSSVPVDGDQTYSYNLVFNSSEYKVQGATFRSYMYSIRPIQVFSELEMITPAGDSMPFLLDTMEGPRVAEKTETIAYSTVWGEGAPTDAVAVVELDGVVLNSETGEGIVNWTSVCNGTHVLTHKVMSGDTQYGDTLTATFLVEGRNPIILPESGTIFDSSLSISISCLTEGATIHYTTDGLDPTTESPVYKRFRITGKTTVKAVVELDGMLSDITVAEYALGRCADPIISPTDGMVFEHSNQEVSIAWTETDGVLRYTLDGSEPTAESPTYDGPFTISESTIIKAKVFSDDFFDSAVVTADLTRVWVNVATPIIDAATSFTGSKTKVALSCATEGALVRYTLNGNEPNSHSTKYTGPFYVTDSCTVKAYAVMADYLNSATATQEVVKVWNIGDTMGKPDHEFTTSGNGGGTGWTRVVDATAPNGEAMKSGAITHNQSSVLSTTVMGPGTLSFAWRTSCEDDPQFEWDHAECAVDGTVVRQLCGVTAWTNEFVEIVGDGSHTVEWRYVKDDVESEGEDAAWVANYQWTSAWTATRTTEVPVPYAWLTAHDPGVVDEYDAYENSAKATAANGRKVWECYVVGVDPESTTNDFKITSFPLKADGTPDLENIVFDPPEAKWNVSGARPVVKGTASLGEEWQAVTEENKAGFRFFKVEVVLP